MAANKVKTPSPLAELKDRFESREALVKELIGLLEDKDPGLEASLNKTSNTKLMKLHATAKVVKRRFGGRQGLIDSVTKLTYPSGNTPPEFVEMIEGSNMKKIYDLHQKRS
jgi:hypothetical protein